MFKQKGKKIRLVFGKPIPFETFDKRFSQKEWADILKEFVYSLAKDPKAEFKVENYSNVSIKLLIDHEISDNQSGISYVILPIVDISNLDEGFTYKNYLTSKIEEVIDEDIGDVLERCKDQIELQKVLNDVSTNTINSLTKVEEDNSFSDKEFESNQENLIAEFLLMMWCEFYVGDTIPTLDDDLVYLNDTVTIKVEGLQYAYTE